MNGNNLLARGMTAFGLATLLSAVPAVAAENRLGMGEMEPRDWRQMEERLRIVEEELARREAAKAEPAVPSLLEAVRERIGIHGLVEVEAFTSEDFAGEDASDITLATVELALAAELNDWSRANILLLWEEDATEPVAVDEAVISLGNPEKFPLYLNAGKLYVPFGVYASYLIQDPLTLELGETNESAVQIGFESRGFYGSAYAFNGDVNEAGSDDTIDGYGVSAGYVTAGSKRGLNVGVDYISNLADADTPADFLFEEHGGDFTIQDQVAGLAAHLHLTCGPFTFYSEYVTALDEFTAGELDFNNRGAEPAAWHLEAAYARELLGKITTFALAWQATDEALGLGLPEQRYLAGLSVALTDNLFWSLEYARDEDYGINEGGTGGDADTVTTQLAVEF